MLILTLAGNLGRDAEHKTTQGGTELCTFSVGVSTGYGETKATTWVDVTKWGKGAEGLARILRKGSKVAVSGEMSLREHNGKTYVQCRADHVTVQGTPAGGDGRGEAKKSYDDGWQGKAPQGNGGGGRNQYDDDDGGIPFATSNSIW